MQYFFEDGDNVRRNKVTIMDSNGMSYKAVLSVKFIETTIVEPVTGDEVKTWCAIDGNDYDSIITILITAARQMVEEYVNKSLISRQVIARVRAGTKLPYGGTISAITITDTDLNAISSVYEDLTDNEEYIVTYTVTPIVTSLLKVAVLQQTAYMYENRGDESGIGLSPMVKSSLKSLRVLW